MVSEAVVERLSVKQSVVQEIEAYCSADCLITTNTLGIRLSNIQAGCVIILSGNTEGGLPRIVLLHSNECALSSPRPD